jgi:hypothetical protein
MVRLRRRMLMVGFTRHHMMMLVLRAWFIGKRRRHRERDRRAGRKSQHRDHEK